ncbi:hypothetical protein [Spirillospora sp. NPDC029432]|uniref:hypothetical protein n=1 Tax=Spirillospora sp. NPDC029432 TaxID=3154599 RepID=UPI003453F5D5
MSIVQRIAIIGAIVAVPLGIAGISQALSDSPAEPKVPDRVQVGESTTPAGPSTGPPVTESPSTGLPPRSPAPGGSPTPSPSPSLVPAPPPVYDDDADDRNERDDDADDG